MKKKTIYYSALVLAILTFVVACQKLENTPQFPTSTASFTITPSPSTVNATASDSLSNVLTFTWDDPKLTAGLENTKFTLILDSTGKNSTYTSKSFTGVLTGSLSGKELNNMAIKFGGKVGQPITIDAVVVASTANNSQPKNSNVVHITYSPYGDLNLSNSNNTVVCAPATATNNADTLTWNSAFNGYSGVKMYAVQYALNGTNFASPTTISASGLSQIFTQRDLNLMAQAVGVVAPGTGKVDFRIKATTDIGTVEYSNVQTVSVTTYVAYNSIGLVGDATAGGWNTDTDMRRPDPVNGPAVWTLTTYLTAATYGVQFRPDDGWATQWGNTTFPSGTGTKTGGNIPITTSGWYKVDFNVASGAYNFTLLSPTTYTVVSIIGNAVGPDPNWTTDFDLTQDVTNPHIWTGTYNFTIDGQFKFRANHDWNVYNWGDKTFPSGYGFINSPDNIPITAGTYFIRFNDVTGEYMVGSTDSNTNAGTPYNQMGVIGDATPGGWGADTYLIQNPTNPYKWSGKVILKTWSDGAKFRANSEWNDASNYPTNWGGSSVPTGIGTLNGPNIPVIVGTSQINFNSATGEYSFEY
ncbi:MAG: SusE domain-containing protein [Cyclobacteriaceae bacterium]